MPLTTRLVDTDSKTFQWKKAWFSLFPQHPHPEYLANLSDGLDWSAMLFKSDKEDLLFQRLELSWSLAVLNAPDTTHTLAILALNKGRSILDAQILDCTPEEWIAKGSWSKNPSFLSMALSYRLQLLDPKVDHTFCALRTLLLGTTFIAQESIQKNASAWCFPRPLTLSGVLDVLRSGRRWALRGESSVVDAYIANHETPNWKDVYIYSIWKAKMENALSLDKEEEALLLETFQSRDLLYWLALSSDVQEHTNFVDKYSANLLNYVSDKGMLCSFLLIQEKSMIELAFLGWDNKHETALVALPIPLDS